MDQKTKPWAFPKPHPENTPRGERNKQEFDAPPRGQAVHHGQASRQEARGRRRRGQIVTRP